MEGSIVEMEGIVMNKISLEHFEHPIPKLKDFKNKPEHFHLSQHYRNTKAKGSARMRRGKIPGRHH